MDMTHGIKVTGSMELDMDLVQILINMGSVLALIQDKDIITW